MLGVATLLEAAGVLNTFTWSFACPAHCHPSVFPVLLAGLLGGVFVGISLSLWIYWIFISHLQVHPPSHPPFPNRAQQLDRLRAYVYERPERAAAAISGWAEAVRGLAFELGRARRPVVFPGGRGPAIGTRLPGVSGKEEAPLRIEPERLSQQASCLHL